MKRISRYKPVGWRGEPHRHYLASKGIKTNRFFSRRKPNTRSGRENTPDRQNRRTTKKAEERITEMFVESLPKEKRPVLANAINRVEELREKKQGIVNSRYEKEIQDAMFKERNLKQQIKQLKNKQEFGNASEEERAYLKSLEKRLTELRKQKFYLNDEYGLKTLGEMRKIIGNIDKEIGKHQDVVDELTGKIPIGATEPRQPSKGVSNVMTIEQLTRLSNAEDLARAYPNIVDSEMSNQEAREVINKEVSDSRVGPLVNVLDSEGKLPKRKRQTVTTKGTTDEGRVELTDRLAKEQEMASEDELKQKQSESEKLKEQLEIFSEEYKEKLPAGGEMKTETSLREFENVPGSKPRFTKRAESRDRASEGKELRKERREKKEKEAEEKEKERQRKDQEDEENGENMAMKSYYSKKTDRNVKKVRKEFGPMERLVAAPVLRSIKSIEQVNESKYGGFIAKEK